MRVDSRSSQPAVAVAQPRTWTTASGRTYTEPAAGAALARGHGGDKVKDLQQRLNAAGLKPPLEADGLFGPRTEAALAKLTGSTTLTAAADAALSKTATATAARKHDGFDAGKKPSLPELPAVVVPDHATPAAGSLAEKTIAIAKGELGSVDPRKTGADGHYEGWQKLQTIFQETTGWKPTDKEIQASSQPQKKAWCGIFAAHVLQEAGANVKWDLNKGQMTGDVKHVLPPPFHDWRTAKTERQAFESSIKPGDVITLNGALNHHAIVTGLNADGTVNTIDGNKPHIGEGHYKLSDVTSYYRATTGNGAQPALPRAPEPVPSPDGVVPTEGGQAGPAAGKSISSQFYKDGVTGSTLSRPDAVMQQRVDLSGDKESRIKALNTFTQFDSKYSEDADDNACGATAIVAGAALDGGPQGLKDLISVIEDRGNTTQIKRAGAGWKAAEIAEWDKLPGIKERVANGTVTQQDLADLKTIVYRQLRQVEKDIGANSTNPTIDIRAIQQYLQTDTAYLGTTRPLAGHFANMNIKLVDTMGTGQGNHFVLMFNDGKGTGENAVFDPWPTKSGNQINRNPDELLWYHHGVKNAVR